MENRLKSIFISLLPTLALFVVIRSSWILWTSEISYTNLGLLLASGSILSFFALIFMFKRARTDANLNINSIFVLIGAIIAGYGLATQSFMTKEVVLLALLVIAWILYLRWYSLFDARAENTALKVGQN